LITPFETQDKNFKGIRKILAQDNCNLLVLNPMLFVTESFID